MKIERISHNKIKVILSADDLKEWNIDFDSLSYSSIEAQEMFWSLMEQAERETGFYVDDSQLIIEAMPFDAEGFVIIITRVDDEDDFESIHKYIKNKYRKSELKVKKRNKKTSTNKLIYIFSEFDHVCDACKRLLSVSIDDSALYQHKDFYYLVLTKNSALDIHLEEIETMLVEYGKKVNYPLIQEGFLNEHGTKIIENDAIDILNTHF